MSMKDLSRRLDMFIGTVDANDENLNLRNGGHPIVITGGDEHNLFKLLDIIGWLCRDNVTFPISEDAWVDRSLSNICNFATRGIWTTRDTVDGDRLGVIVICDPDK